jgi:hypothetical protein
VIEPFEDELRVLGIYAGNALTGVQGCLLFVGSLIAWALCLWRLFVAPDNSFSQSAWANIFAGFTTFLLAYPFMNYAGRHRWCANLIGVSASLACGGSA